MTLTGIFGRLAVGSALLAIAIGCGPSYGGHHHHGRIHSHGGRGGSSGSGLLIAGIVVGAVIAQAASNHQEPEREERVYVNNYYYTGPPVVTPRSSRDNVSSDELPAFDPQAARGALNTIDVSPCHEATGAPKGFGHAKITFNPDGRISKVVVDEPRGMSSEAVACIGERLGSATVRPFRGSLVTMGTTFRVQ